MKIIIKFLKQFKLAYFVIVLITNPAFAGGGGGGGGGSSSSVPYLFPLFHILLIAFIAAVVLRRNNK